MKKLLSADTQSLTVRKKQHFLSHDQKSQSNHRGRTCRMNPFRRLLPLMTYHVLSCRTFLPSKLKIFGLLWANMPPSPLNMLFQLVKSRSPWEENRSVISAVFLTNAFQYLYHPTSPKFLNVLQNWHQTENPPASTIDTPYLDTDLTDRRLRLHQVTGPPHGDVISRSC